MTSADNATGVHLPPAANTNNDEDASYIDGYRQDSMRSSGNDHADDSSQATNTTGSDHTHIE